MEQIQFVYIQDYMQYYTVHHKENRTYMEIWHRGRWLKLRPQLPVCFGFTIFIILFISPCCSFNNQPLGSILSTFGLPRYFLSSVSAFLSDKFFFLFTIVNELFLSLSKILLY